MRFGPANRHRRSVRLPAFDYRSAGAYFVTICTHERALIFDDPRTRRAVELALLSVGRYCRPASVDELVVMPNHVHAIIWLATNDRIPVRDVGAQHTGHRNDTAPTDLHRQAHDVGAQHAPRAQHVRPTDDHPFSEPHSGMVCAAPLRGRGQARARRVEAGSSGAVVRGFKSATTKRINAMRNTPGVPVWQRNYHEHIIRDDGDLQRIRQYVRDNPAKWADDPDNPANIAKAP